MLLVRYFSLLSIIPFIYCKELKYALFTSGPTGSFDSSGAVPAIELAEELINADSSILPGYNLTHTPVVDTECDRTISLNEYFSATSPSQPTVLGLLGCGCSAASQPVAEIIHHNSLSQISYASSWSGLSERSRSPNFFSTWPPEYDFYRALVTLVHHYGWRRIVIITETESLFTELGQSLVTSLGNSGLEVASRMVPIDTLLDALDDTNIDFFFEKDDYRVFFINTRSKVAQQIFCKAYQKGLTYPRYAWITHGRYDDKWWMENTSEDCSDDQLGEFVHRTLAVTKQYTQNSTDSDILLYSKLTQEELRYRYAQRLKTAAKNFNYTGEFLIPDVALDALWAFALALNRTSEMVASLTREEILNRTQCEGCDDETGVEWALVPLDNFTYSNQLMGCVIRWNLERTDFVGVSGLISFDETGLLAHSRVRVFQYLLDEDRTAIAYIEHVNKSFSHFVYTNNETTLTVFPSRVPPDGTPVTVRITYHLALVVTFYLLAAAGIVFISICLVFNYTQRKKRVVRFNSPNLNYLVIIGSYIMCIAIFSRIMPSTDFTVNAARCNLSTLLTTIGYCLAFGGVLVKMGRIHYILHNQTTSRKNLKDWHLLIIALVITGIGTLLAVLQVSIPILQPQPYDVPNEEPPSAPMNEYGLRIMEVVVFCYSPTRTTANIWIIVTCGYLALLQFIGLILAVRLHKVNLKALENSRYIVAAVYISAICLMLVMVALFAINNLPNIIELLFSASLLASTAVFLFMIFIPKMVSVYRDPEDNNVFNDIKNFTGNVDTTTIKTNISAIITDDSTKISQLESKIASLQRAIRQYEVHEDQSSSLSSVVCVDSGKGSDIPLVRIIPLNGNDRYRITIDEAAASPPK